MKEGRGFEASREIECPDETRQRQGKEGGFGRRKMSIGWYIIAYYAYCEKMIETPTSDFTRRPRVGCTFAKIEIVGADD